MIKLNQITHGNCLDVLPTIPKRSVQCVVLDPFVGAGTTAVVAKRTGRSFIGIEASAEYVRMSRRRLENVTEPLIAE